MINFWGTLPKPFFILAPMEDVTDTVFRNIVKKWNNNMPQVLFTEFTNCDGVCSIGQSRVIHRLKYDSITERPIVAQIWGKTPKNYFETAKLCMEMGFDGVDINMGCPEKNVIKQGCCSALINNLPLAKEVIQATQQGVNGSLPISVKTRIGFKKIETMEWFSFLLEQNLQAITVHGRTVSGSQNPANWKEIMKVVKLNKTLYNKTKKQRLDEAKQSWIDLIDTI